MIIRHGSSGRPLRKSVGDRSILGGDLASLHLHIGHPKTGSSYIQSCLAASIEPLERCGISYPAPKDVEAAAAGMISSGNGNLLSSLIKNPAPPSGNLLLSSELLFWSLMQKPFATALRHLVERAEIRLHVLLFIRDPVAHACSSFQQSVKRKGYTGTLSEFLRQYEVPKYVNEILEQLREVPSASVTVKNYSAINSDVIAHVEEWLKIPPALLSRPAVAIVNRSLTRAELALQRELNTLVGASGYLAADLFCNSLPELASEVIRPSLEEQNALWERLAPEIDRVNAQVESCARYVKARDILDASSHDSDEYVFSSEQLHVLASSLSARAVEIQRTKELAADCTSRMEAQLRAAERRIEELQIHLREFEKKSAPSPRFAKRLETLRRMFSSVNASTQHPQ